MKANVGSVFEVSPKIRSDYVHTGRIIPVEIHSLRITNTEKVISFFSQNAFWRHCFKLKRFLKMHCPKLLHSLLLMFFIAIKFQSDYQMYTPFSVWVLKETSWYLFFHNKKRCNIVNIPQFIFIQNHLIWFSLIFTLCYFLVQEGVMHIIMQTTTIRYWKCLSLATWYIKML